MYIYFWETGRHCQLTLCQQALTKVPQRRPSHSVLRGSILNVEDVAGAAGGEVECVQEHLPGQAEHHQLVVQILLAALGDLTRPHPCTLRHAHALANPDHLLVVRVLLLHRVHDEPPLQLGVPCCPRPDEWLHQLTGRVWGLLQGHQVIVSGHQCNHEITCSSRGCLWLCLYLWRWWGLGMAFCFIRDHSGWLLFRTWGFYMTQSHNVMMITCLM